MYTVWTQFLLQGNHINNLFNYTISKITNCQTRIRRSSIEIDRYAKKAVDGFHPVYHCPLYYIARTNVCDETPTFATLLAKIICFTFYFHFVYKFRPLYHRSLRNPPEKKHILITVSIAIGIICNVCVKQYQWLNWVIRLNGLGTLISVFIYYVPLKCMVYVSIINEFILYYMLWFSLSDIYQY